MKTTVRRCQRPVALALIIAAIALVLAGSGAWSQEVAIGTATATVLAAVTVAATSALAYGDVFQGVPKAVANNAAAAGIFTISGEADAGATLYFQLPDYLVLSDGSVRMGISF